MRHIPSKHIKYSGLTIVLSNPSRFDKIELLSSRAGKFVNSKCLGPELNKYQCDIRTADTIKEGWLPGTKVVLLCGERALHTALPEYKEYSVGEQRGCKLKGTIPGITFISTFSPQDALDIQDWEDKFNPEAHYEAEGIEQEDKEEHTGKRKGVTSRVNYGWWIEQDFRKAKNILLAGADYYRKDPTNIILWPTAKDAVEFLRSKKNESLYLDIETDSNYNITCIGVAYDYHQVMVLPCLLWDYSPAYSNLGAIFQALVWAMNNNEVVCHNSLYDLFILAWKYHVPCGRILYDTMLAHHRSYPEMEKSLGHCMSHLLHEPYHKDTSIFNPSNEYQARKLWTYNANDVRGTVLIREELDKKAKKIPGLLDSIQQSNKSIRPDLINTLQGINFDDEKRQQTITENDRLCNHYLHTIKLLTDGIEVLPTSSPSCVKYFHELLGYKVVARSKKTNRPSLGEQQLYKIKLKEPHNPVIDLSIAFRRKVKSSGMLKFEPWVGVTPYAR